jgi:hypothetical protein
VKGNHETTEKTVRFSIFALAIGLTIFSNQLGHAQEHHTVNLSNARGLPYSDESSPGTLSTSPVRKGLMTLTS